MIIRPICALSLVLVIALVEVFPGVASSAIIHPRAPFERRKAPGKCDIRRSAMFVLLLALTILSLIVLIVGFIWLLARAGRRPGAGGLTWAPKL